MTVYLDDTTGKTHEILCDRWEHEEDRYVFRDEKGRIVAVFQKHGIIGFTVSR